MSPFACYVDPTLSTMHQDTRALGHQATQMLLERIAGDEPEAPVELQTHLIVRDSTAPPSTRLAARVHVVRPKEES